MRAPRPVLVSGTLSLGEPTLHLGALSSLCVELGSRTLRLQPLGCRWGPSHGCAAVKCVTSRRRSIVQGQITSCGVGLCPTLRKKQIFAQPPDLISKSLQRIQKRQERIGRRTRAPPKGSFGRRAVTRIIMVTAHGGFSPLCGTPSYCFSVRAAAFLASRSSASRSRSCLAY